MPKKKTEDTDVDLTAEEVKNLKADVAEVDDLKKDLKVARAASTRVENQYDDFKKDVAALVDELYAAWWANDRDATQLVIRKFKEKLSG